MGLEQKEEPAAAWWSDHRLLVLWWGSFPGVACVGGWWVVFWVVGGAAVETLFIKISGVFIGVSLWCLCRMTGTKWNLRCGIRGKYGTNVEAQRASLVLFPICVMKIGLYLCLFVCNTCPSEIRHADWAQKTFVLTLLRWNIMTLPYKMCLACEKTNGLCVMLGTARTWAARTLDVFLEPRPRSTPPAVFGCDSRSCPSCVLWEDLFFPFFFCVRFSRPLLKDKPRLRRGRMTDEHFLSASPLLKTTRAVFGKKKKAS